MGGGVQQCWIMSGIGRRRERLSLTSCPCLLHCWRTKVFLREFILSPFPLSGWILPTTTVRWSKAFRPKWLPLESQLPAVHGLMFSQHAVMSRWCHGVLHGCSMASRGVRETEKGGVGPRWWTGVPWPAVESELTCTALMWTGEVDCSFMLGQGTQRHHAHLHHQPRLSQSGDSREVRGGANKRTHRWRQEVVQPKVVLKQDWGNTSKWMNQKDTQWGNQAEVCEQR